MNGFSMLVRLCTLGPTQLLTRLFAGRTGPKPMWISVPRETAHPSLHTAMARTAHRLVWLAMVGSVYCTLPDAARATGRAAPAADRRRPAQLRPVEIHRPTIAPTSLRRAERGARAGGSDHTAPAGDRRRGAPTPTAERTTRALPHLAVVLPDPTQPHPLLPPAATSPASRPRGGSSPAEVLSPLLAPAPRRRRPGSRTFILSLSRGRRARSI